MSTVLERPLADECAPFYAGYVDEVPPGADVRAVLRDQARLLPAAFAAVTEARAAFRYAEGKWSIKEVVGHLSDAERVFSYRLLRIARGDTTPLAGFDEDEYVRTAEFDRRPWSDLVGEWVAVRQATLALINGLDDSCWLRRGIASGRVVTVRALAYITVGHTVHHVGVLRDRYGVATV